MKLDAKNISEVGYDFRRQEVILFFKKAEVINNINKKEYRFSGAYEVFVEFSKKIFKKAQS